MKKSAGKIIQFVLRWTIAIVGIVWVVSNIHLKDRVHILGPDLLPVEVELVKGSEDSDHFEIRENSSSDTRIVSSEDVINGPDRKTVTSADGKVIYPLLGMRLIGDINQKPVVRDLLIKDEKSGLGKIVHVSDLKDFTLDVPQPRVEQGVGSMVRQADRRLLIAAFCVLPITYLCTTIRWGWLLRALGISISLYRVLVLNMVGAFYNTFMPGSTGGDVLKAYYAAKQVPTKRTAAVMSVIIDRIIGLLALILLGGFMATVKYYRSTDPNDPVAKACFRVAISAGILLLGTGITILLVYSRKIRNIFGLSRIYALLPMQDKLNKIIDVLRIYRTRPVLMFWSVMITFPVHITVVISAMLSGMAFGLPITWPYYFIVVPVVVLVGALPLSPQGVGVMEAFAFYLTRQQGATVNQALALTMSIRLLQICWNLLGGLFVLRGGYHSPTESEQAELQSDTQPVASDAT